MDHGDSRLDLGGLDLHNGPMRAAIAASTALLLIACSGEEEGNRIPSIEDVHKLETKVATHPCVRGLQRWERNYRFAVDRRLFWPQSDYVDRNVIEFHFRGAGTIVIRPERNLIASDSRDWRDSAAIQTIDGFFVINSGRLRVAGCKPIPDRLARR